MLVIEDLKKKYGKFEALKGVSFEVGKGEIFGFIGPNGAGKSTTMKIMAGLLKPDSGKVFIDDKNVLKDTTFLKRSIGCMPDFFGTYNNLTAIEYLDFFASIYGYVGKDTTKFCMDLLELVNLKDKTDSQVDGLSRGMKQRLCLARCLVHNPSLLILDEPASGMDPISRIEMKGILKNLQEMDKTIIISSHILTEMAEMCSQVGVISSGEMVYVGEMDELVSMDSATKTAKFKIRVIDDAEKAILILKEIPEILKVLDFEKEIEFNAPDDDVLISQIIKKMVQEDVPIVSLEKLSANLEDKFMELIKG